jgi:phosphoribosylformylglycinamidine cyclo-ligase
MHRTFNCGIGMVICVSPEEADHVASMLNHSGEQARCIGRIEKAKDGEHPVQLLNL